MKKTFALLLTVVLLICTLSSCKISLIDGESKAESTVSDEESAQTVVDDGEAVMTYKDYSITEGMYKFVAAKQKGVYAYVYNKALGIDFDANPDYWDYIYSDDITFAEYVQNESINVCKSMLVYEYLCDTNNIAHVTDESSEEYIDGLATNYDSRSDFETALATVGCTVDTVKKYYDIYTRVAELKDMLTGQDGALYVADDDAAAWFDEYVRSNYVKVDATYFSFYESDYQTKYISDAYTDDDAAQYFLDNYIKYRYIKYDVTSKVLAKNCLAELKNGSTTIADKLGESTDNVSEAIITSSDDDYNAISAIAVGSFDMIEKDDCILVVARVKASASDITAALRSECKWQLTCADITNDANDAYAKLVDGTYDSFDDLPGVDYYLLHGGEVLVQADTLSEDFYKLVKYDTETDNYGIYTMYEDGAATGIYVYKKLAVSSDDCEDVKADKISDYKDGKFDEYIDGFIDAVSTDNAKITLISIKELKSLLFW